MSFGFRQAFACGLWVQRHAAGAFVHFPAKGARGRRGFVGGDTPPGGVAPFCPGKRGQKTRQRGDPFGNPLSGRGLRRPLAPPGRLRLPCAITQGRPGQRLQTRSQDQNGWSRCPCSARQTPALHLLTFSFTPAPCRRRFAPNVNAPAGAGWNDAGINDASMTYAVLNSAPQRNIITAKRCRRGKTIPQTQVGKCRGHRPRRGRLWQ